MPFPAQPAHLLALPAEVLLIILGELYEIHHFPRKQSNGISSPSDLEIGSTTFRSICGLRPISAVNRRFRPLCLPLRFKITRCTNAERLQELSAKCKADPEFAGLIKQLVIADIDTDTDDILPELLPCLTSLMWLELEANQLGERLLAVANSHPNLATVAVRDSQLKSLIRLLSFTDLPFSKILVSATTVDRRLTVKSEAFHAVVKRGARFSHLALQEAINFDNADVSLPDLLDLEQLELELPSTADDSLQRWLPNIAQRHANLSTIKFYGWWNRHQGDVPFVIPFRDALRDREIYSVSFNSVSIARPASSWTSLKDWEVVHLKLRMSYTSRIPALGVVSELAPQLSSLDIVLELPCSWPTHIDEFVKPFSFVTSLRTLHLTNAYAHLQVGGRSPWIHSQRTSMSVTREMLGSSTAVTALHALHWYMARVAQQATSLDLIHVTDEGHDGKGRSKTPWTLQASFGVRPNEARDLEILGTPRLQMAPRYLPRRR
ncbi:hypothetical protein B0H19DRAFT_1113518 [Mycena capillaripes]|nr:hypothetical protein B0H19DRAFT_1113518 [Mycena capillaripes]